MYPLLFILFGFLVGYFFDIPDIKNSSYITFISDFALAVGLYGSVYGIDVNTLKKNMEVVFLAITIGVILKIALIGGILWLYMDSPVAFLLAAIIAQIDPLSISALEKSKYLSKDGETILRAWSSFDDPITIIISLWLAMFIYVHGDSDFNITISTAATTFYYNLFMAVVIYFLWRFLRPLNKIVTCISLLIISFFLAIYFELFLGLAVIALFVRPPLYDKENIIIFITLLIVSLILGLLISNGINLIVGLILGILTIISQAVVSFFLTEKMSFNDKVKLSFAHQSGITAISLSLYFIQYDSLLIQSISVAIITINFGYIISNWIIDCYVIPIHHNKKL